MTLSSMTGFSRADDGADESQWHWELRSVNSRGLDLRVRLPAGFERLEPQVRSRLQNRLSRGACTASLTVRRGSGNIALRINETALEAVLSASERLRGQSGLKPPSIDGLLSLKGVLEVDEPDTGNVEGEQDEAILGTLDRAVDDLMAMRREEGERLATIIEDQLARISELTGKAKELPSRATDEIRRRIEEQIARLVGEAGDKLDRDRLHQEAVLLATKVDIQEELDRLDAHVEAARQLLRSEEAVGRRLDFLTQEFNREANTICSKSNDIALTQLGLEMKSVVDQLREQVQNVE